MNGDHTQINLGTCPAAMGYEWSNRMGNTRMENKDNLFSMMDGSALTKNYRLSSV